jgi:uncharacterized protein
LSLDIAPLIPIGRQLIQSYRGGVFRIAQIEYTGPVIVFPDRTIAWNVSSFDALTPEDFESIVAAGAAVEVLLLGCGPSMRLPSASLKSALKTAGVVVEPMDTGAACRTFNVLMGEDRRVAAALLPVP